MYYEVTEVFLDEHGRSARRKIILYQPDGVRFHASSKLVEDEKPVTDAVNWQTLGGVQTNPSFFTENLASSFGRVVGSINVVGSNVRLRLVERDLADDSEVVVSDEFVCADTGGAWKAMKFSTNVPSRVGDMEYRLEGKLDGAASAQVRFVSVSLLEILPTE